MTTGAGTRLPSFPAATGFTDTDLLFMTQGATTVKGTVAQLRKALLINRAVETFVAGTDFTAGTTPSLTLAGTYGSINNVDVYCDGVPQLDCILSGNALTFNPTIPFGTKQVVVKGGYFQSIGAPADGSITNPKLAAQSVTPDKLRLTNSVAGPTDIGTVEVVRNAQYNGGTFGWVNSALQLRTEVGSNPATFENALTCILNNHATAGENTSIFMQSNKFSTGPTWGIALECREKVATNNPSTGTIGIELNVNSNGTDVLQQRRALAIFSSCDNPGGAQAETGYGIVFSSQPGDANKGRFKTGIGFGSSGNVVDFDYGLDFTYATFNAGDGSAINLAANQSLSFAPSRRMFYNGVSLVYGTTTAPSGVFQI